jgi:hypothetical protein
MDAATLDLVLNHLFPGKLKIWRKTVLRHRERRTEDSDQKKKKCLKK